MPSRRLEDRIRELCAKALNTQAAELDQVLIELRAGLREHNERFRRLAARRLSGDPSGKERRSA